MQHFNLLEKDHNKIKQMIYNIIYRKNNMPLILHINENNNKQNLVLKAGIQTRNKEQFNQNHAV